MAISIIVAMSENGVIGRDDDLPWHLSADLQKFKQITMGHHIVMGRKTYESINQLLPGRTTVIVTRQSDYQIEGAITLNNLTELEALGAVDSEVFIIGGGQIYQAALGFADTLYVTRVHAHVEGDTEFPAVDWDAWRLESSEEHPADDRNDHDFSFEVWQKR